MQNAMIIFRQLVIMFIYIAVGFVLFKTKTVSKEGSKALASVMLYLIIPCVILKSMWVARTPENTTTFLWSLLAAVAALGLSMAVSAVIYRRRPIDNFGAAFSNAGFMGIPLITAVLGGEWVFSITALIAILNVLQWTYGQAVLTGNPKACSPKSIFTSPLVIAFLLGLIFFFVRVPEPRIISDCLDGIAALNAPVAMLVLGAYLAEGKLSEIFRDWHLYAVSAVRLAVIPVLTLLVLSLFPAGNMRLAVLIAASAPIGANVAVYAGRVGADYPYAARTVCLSTILSVVTMPLVVMLAEFVW